MPPSHYPHFILLFEWRWFVALGLVAWLVLFGTLPRNRAGLALLLVSAFTHWVTYAPRVQMHDLTPYLEIMGSNGMLSPDMQYGEGRVALMQWPLALMGFPIDGTHWIDGVLSVLAVPHLYAAMRHLFGERVAVVSALLLAIAPLPLAIAPTESAFVALATMEVLAIHGLCRQGWVGDLMIVIGAGFVTHLRPLEGLFGVAMVAVAWASGRRRAAVGVATMVLWRLEAFWSGAVTHNGYPLDQWNRLDFWWSQLAGPDGRLIVFNPMRTPAILALLVPVGLVAGGKLHKRATAGLFAMVVGGTLIYINMGIPSDAFRYQSPVQVWWCALAGIGLVAVARRPWWLAVVVLLGVPSYWIARHPYPPFPWQVEHALLREALATLPPGTTVAYDASVDNQGVEADWVKRYAGVHFVPLEAADAQVQWRWVGLADHVHTVQPPPDGAPTVTTTIVSKDGAWGCEKCDGTPMTIGLYEVR